MTKDIDMKFWFDTFKSRLWLTLITYALFMLLCILIDNQAREFYLFERHPVWYYVIDVLSTLMCAYLFVQISIFYSHSIYKWFTPKGRPYRKLIIYSIILFAMNNLTAYLLSLLTGILFDLDDLPFLQVQHLYIYSILATIVSSIYIDAHYLHSYMTAEIEKKRLEMVAMQAQLATLKQQIDPHFMFNNFSILSELIMEDRSLAIRFLDNLSKVYRYIIQNYNKNTVRVSEELTFLDSYLYLMEIRYERAVIVIIDPGLRKVEGSIPPVSLQLLVENALKHNCFSEEQPLLINISQEDDCVIVSNVIRPLPQMPKTSTGIGQRNIMERYSLLSKRKPTIEQANGVYSVRLPIFYNNVKTKEEA